MGLDLVVLGSVDEGANQVGAAGVPVATVGGAHLQCFVSDLAPLGVLQIKSYEGDSYSSLAAVIL